MITYTKLAERNVSFQLLRTNPKLTTNVKLTVDSVGGLWFNSIDANEQLADQKYKRFPINETTSHEVNLHRFYDSGKTPTNIAYQVGSTIGIRAVAKDLKDQFDFDLYTSGAKYLTSKQYSEKFSYLAPLYLDQVLPSKFVIFKVPGASNYTAGRGKTLQTITVQDFATDLFRNATIVKVFDLGKTSKIGQYLENIIKNPMFNSKPLYVNHKVDGYSLYRGASIASGTYVEIPEQLSTIFSRALPLLKVEEFITLGYERNGVVYPRILNMEFLFDDDTSDDYSINRYFGFYCNDIDLEEFEIDLDRMYAESAENQIAVETVSQLVLSPSSTFSLQLTGTNLDDLGIANLSFDQPSINLTNAVFSSGILTVTGTYTNFPDGTILTISTQGANPISFEYQPTVSGPSNTLVTTLPWIELETIETDPFVNDQPLPIRYNQSDDISFILTNSTGVKLNGKGLDQDLSDINFNRTSKDTLFFPYLKAKTGDLHLINSYDWNQDKTLVTFKIDDTELDLGTLFGPTDLVAQPTASVSNDDTRSTVCVEISNRPDHLDRLRIYHPSGSCLDINDEGGRYDEIVFVKSFFSPGDNYSVDYPTIPTITFTGTDPNSVAPSSTPFTPANIGTQYVSLTDGRKWYYNGTEYVEGVYGSRIYLNADADIDQMCVALYNISIELLDSSIIAIPFEDRVYFQSRRFGDAYGELKIRVISSTPSTFKVNGAQTNSLVWADGGFLNKPHAIIDAGNIDKLTPILDSIVVKTNTNWSKISRVCRATDPIRLDLTADEKLKASTYFNNSATIQLVDDEVVNVVYDKIEIRNLYKPKIGVLSLFEIMDIDFSTYMTRYSRNLFLDLYKDFYIPAGVALLDFTKYSYEIVGDGTIEINGTVYSKNDAVSGVRPLVWQNTSSLSKYTVIDGDAILIYAKKRPNTTTDPLNTTYPDRLDIPYYDESNDLIDFIGPFALKATHSLQSTQAFSYNNRDKYVLGNVSSEYHIYLENFSLDYATNGRVIPYITKWGLEDSTDSRDNPYRLNSDISFSKDNFGPSHRETAPTPEKLTHEWFYIESYFNYLADSKLARLNFSYFDTPIQVDELTTDPDYFETYFTYVPKVNGVEVDRPQLRYSILNKNAFTRQYETLFKGAKFKFYEIDDFGNTITDTTRFEDYKFSILLKPIKEDPSITRQPIKYRVIENTDSKSIAVVIEVAIGHNGQLNQTFLNKGWSVSTDDVIDQTTLFDNYLPSEVSSYKIDSTIYATSLTQYNNLINGIIPLGSNLGETVHVVYSPLYSAILASEGSDVYSAVLNGLIANGDVLATDIVCSVNPSVPMILNQGSYAGVRIEATNTSLSSQWFIPQSMNSNDLAVSDFSVIHNVAYYDAIMGDYRIQFNGVSNLTHSFMYYAKHKKYNNKASAYSTIKLSRGVDLSTSGITFNPATLNPESIETLRLEGLLNYDSTADSELSQVNIGFSPMYIIKPGQKNLLLQIDTGLTPSISNLSDPTKTEDGILGSLQNLVLLTQNSSKTLYVVSPLVSISGSGLTFTYSATGAPTGTSFTWAEDSQHFQIFGGVKYFERLFANLSFAKFAQLLDASQDIISWESYTGGVKSNLKKLSMEVSAADEIVKSTIVKISPVNVQSGQINQVAGFTLSEVNSQPYSVNRYSGEYDIITKPIAGFKYGFSINGNDLTGANVCLNPEVDNFFIIPDFEFVKYSKTSILDLENSQNYTTEYPLIGETPIDRTSLNILSSSWDYGYHFEYSDKTNFAKIPGSRRVTEDYSFVSKLINLPNSFIVSDFTSSQLDNQQFILSNATSANLVYSIFGGEIRFKINVSDLITKQLSNNGIRSEFEKFFKDESGLPILTNKEFLGDLTFEQYLSQYCETNLVKLFQIEAFEFYELDDSTISGNLVQFLSLDYDSLSELGYTQVRNVKINNTKSNVVEGSILIKPNTGVKIVPKIKIKFI